MLGRNNGITCPTFFYQIHPSLRIIFWGSETIFLTHIFLIGQILIKKRPAFGYSFHRINTPMNKNAQLGICKPLHPFFLLRIYLFLLRCLSPNWSPQKSEQKQRCKQLIFHDNKRFKLTTNTQKLILSKNQLPQFSLQNKKTYMSKNKRSV